MNMSSKFDDDWQTRAEFQGWLMKVSNDYTKAFCRVCSLVLRSDQGELLAHSKCAKHIENHKEFHAQAASAVQQKLPMNVHIITQPDATLVENLEGVHGHSVQENKISLPETVDKDSKLTRRRSAVDVKKKYSKYIKRYRPVWETETEFKNWLSPFPNDISRAYCKACKTILRAHKHDLTCHARTTRHKKYMSKYECADTNNSETNVKILGSIQNAQPMENGPYVEVITTSDDHFTTNTSDMKVKGIESVPFGDHEISIANLTTEFLPSASTDPGNSVDSQRHSRVNVLSPKFSADFVRDRSPMRKRYRITASDIVNAIQNDEFTGYELLQIVKAAVPKL